MGLSLHYTRSLLLLSLRIFSFLRHDCFDLHQYILCTYWLSTWVGASSSCRSGFSWWILWPEQEMSRHLTLMSTSLPMKIVLLSWNSKAQSFCFTMMNERSAFCTSFCTSFCSTPPYFSIPPSTRLLVLANISLLAWDCWSFTLYPSLHTFTLWRINPNRPFAYPGHMVQNYI